MRKVRKVIGLLTLLSSFTIISANAAIIEDNFSGKYMVDMSLPLTVNIADKGSSYGLGLNVDTYSLEHYNVECIEDVECIENKDLSVYPGLYFGLNGFIGTGDDVEEYFFIKGSVGYVEKFKNVVGETLFSLIPYISLRYNNVFDSDIEYDSEEAGFGFSLVRRSHQFEDRYVKFSTEMDFSIGVPEDSSRYKTVEVRIEGGVKHFYFSAGYVFDIDDIPDFRQNLSLSVGWKY